MILYKNKNGRQECYNLYGYPHVKKYKYLGSIVDSTLSCLPGLEAISRGVSGLKFRWGGVMKATGIQFAKNLFNEKVRPKYLLGVSRLF
jgi:hypothetical protein